MKILGFLFLIVLLVAVVGWFRGWFSVTTAHAGTHVTVHVDEGKIRDDSRSAAESIADTSEKIAAVVKSVGHRTTTAESTLHGTITAVDMVARDLMVRVDSDDRGAAPPTLRLRVPTALAITRDGASVGFEQVRLGDRVCLTFVDADADRRLARIELL